jgi:hypothetical protein
VERKWKVLYTMLLIPRKAGRKKAWLKSNLVPLGSAFLLI